MSIAQAQAPAGQPMTHQQGTTLLSFGRIADAWAQEIAGRVGALTRDEIVARLSAALRSGEFDEALDAGELYLQFRPDPIDGGDQDFDWLRLWTCDADSAAGEPMELSPLPRRHRADAITISMLARLFGDRADAASRNRAWLDLFEQAEITRGAFSSWVFRAGLTPPSFWSAAAAASAPTAGKKRGRKLHEGESLVLSTLEMIAWKRRKDPLTWLEEAKVETLKKLVMNKLMELQKAPRAEVLNVPGRTKMREIVSEWRSAKLGAQAPRTEFANSAAALP